MRESGYTRSEGGSVTRDDNGTPTDFTDDCLLYTPPSGFSGTDSFSYTVDNYLNSLSVATVSLLVLANNNEVTFSLIDAQGDDTSTPRIARWEGVNDRTIFRGPNLAPTGVNIQEDANRYRVRVVDAEANINPTESDTIGVSLYTDLGTLQLTLLETGPNTHVFQSSDIVLVSNQKDVDYLAGKGLKAALGDIGSLGYGGNATHFTVESSMTVSLNVIILNDATGKPFVAQEIVERDLKFAKETLAQAGVELIYSPPATRQPKENIVLSDGLSNYDYNRITRKIILSPEEKMLFDDADFTTTTNSDIEVYYLNPLTGDNNARGEAIWKSGLEGNDLIYRNRIVMTAIEDRNYALAHEIIHILMDSGVHYNQYPNSLPKEVSYPNQNLMVGGGRNTEISYRSDDWNASKRIWQAQIDELRAPS